MRVWVTAAAAATLALALLAAVGGLFGHPPLALLRILVEGAFGSAFAAESTLLRSVPLLLTGLAIVIAFRAGVWNIGGEGQFIVGALAAFLASPAGSIPALLAAAAAGAAWASVASALRLWRNAPEVLTTILLNFIAIHLLGWAVNGPIREGSGQYPQTEAVASNLASWGRVHAGVPIAVLASIVAWVLLYRTAGGLRLRATGSNWDAARWAGVDVRMQLVKALAMSGAAAGLAGGIELLGVTGRLFERFAAGYGYAGIAVALLAQLHPLATIAAALFFAALTTGAGELQRTAGIAAAIATFGQAVVILVVVAANAVWRRRWSS